MITRGDDSDAFGQPELLRINFVVPEGQTVSKAILKCGTLQIEFDEPVSPLDINLTGQQTAILKDNNCCDFIMFDGMGKRLTVPCIAEVKTTEDKL